MWPTKRTPVLTDKQWNLHSHGHINTELLNMVRYHVLFPARFFFCLDQHRISHTLNAIVITRRCWRHDTIGQSAQEICNIYQLNAQTQMGIYCTEYYVFYCQHSTGFNEHGGMCEIGLGWFPFHAHVSAHTRKIY